MSYLATVLALALGIALGRRRAARVPAARPSELAGDGDLEERARATWAPRVSPERYLRNHPDGPFADQARIIVGQSEPTPHVRR